MLYQIIFNCLDQEIISDKQIITIIELHIVILYVSFSLDKLIDSILESIDNLIGIIPKISDEILLDPFIKVKIDKMLQNKSIPNFMSI